MNLINPHSEIQYIDIYNKYTIFWILRLINIKVYVHFGVYNLSKMEI